MSVGEGKSFTERKKKRRGKRVCVRFSLVKKERKRVREKGRQLFFPSSWIITKDEGGLTRRGRHQNSTTGLLR